jgi:hypothetical protein
MKPQRRENGNPWYRNHTKVEEQGKAFREIKRTLTNAHALGLPDVMKPFFLYVH